MAKHDAIQWDEALENKVIDAIESGFTIRQTAEETGIDRSAIIRRVIVSSAFARRYARAMETRTDLDFEELMDSLEDEPQRNKFGIDPAWVQLKRLKVDTIKWALSKRNPKKYGDRIDHNVDGQVNINFAAKSILDAPEPKQIEGKVDAVDRQLDANSTTS